MQISRSEIICVQCYLINGKQCVNKTKAEKNRISTDCCNSFSLLLNERVFKCSKHWSDYTNSINCLLLFIHSYFALVVIIFITGQVKSLYLTSIQFLDYEFCILFVNENVTVVEEKAKNYCKGKFFITFIKAPFIGGSVLSFFNH